ncbi:hypothetical protein AJ79_04137 [Helicocarpus griseus UAMH5409]|uniref:Uncharacterized protein n=1 Tax=Helicocarpus griseus UAMH5409 TaxID=1447875 RepID=A0A2B7XUJ4_9EURO|nr:hypothetical protein AJ79_04137 [Helicocarpus griseus UAMH5409]
MEQIREVTTLETPINPNLSRELQLLAATPRWQRPDSATISALLNGAVAHKDVELLADAVQVLADKWDGAVDFWEFDTATAAKYFQGGGEGGEGAGRQVDGRERGSASAG